MQQTPSCISIIGGDFFDILSPETSEYSIETIASALSMICRYTGHVDKFYSVAEHCVHVSYAITEKYALEGLLHDASEAFVGDVSSPLKKLLPNYKKIEENIQKDICSRFGLIYPLPEDVHKADKQLYWSERKMIAPAKDTLWHGEFRSSRKVEPEGWSPSKAKRKFLNRYNELRHDRS